MSTSHGRKKNVDEVGSPLSVCEHGIAAAGDDGLHIGRADMEEKIRLRIKALEGAIERTESPYLKRDCMKQIKKLPDFFFRELPDSAL